MKSMRDQLRVLVSVGLVSGGIMSCTPPPGPGEDVVETQSALILANRGTINNDNQSDIVLSGSGSFTTIPVAFRTTIGDGSFSVTNTSFAAFQGLAAVPGVKIVPGDFNGDGRSDLALTGGSGWTSIPVAISLGNGSYTLWNQGVLNFPAFASTPGAKAVAGDFNSDGRADIALTGGSGWTTIPIAFSNGNGTFNVTPGTPVADFPGWAATAGVKAVAGDFNNDGRADIALTGVSGWTTIPVAFGNGTGGFARVNPPVMGFPGLASIAGVKIVSGDFNADGLSDILLTGGSGWTTVPVAFGTFLGGTFTFSVTNFGLDSIPALAATSGAMAVSGDFNGDGRSDFALTGGSGWPFIPVAYSLGNGTFSWTVKAVSNFPLWSTFSGAKAIGAM